MWPLGNHRYTVPSRPVVRKYGLGRIQILLHLPGSIWPRGAGRNMASRPAEPQQTNSYLYGLILFWGVTNLWRSMKIYGRTRIFIDLVTGYSPYNPQMRYFFYKHVICVVSYLNFPSLFLIQAILIFEGILYLRKIIPAIVHGLYALFLMAVSPLTDVRSYPGTNHKSFCRASQVMQPPPVSTNGLETSLLPFISPRLSASGYYPTPYGA